MKLLVSMSGQRHLDVVESVICQLLLGSESVLVGFPGGSAGKESACSAGDPGFVPGSGRSPGEGQGNPLQFSCLENSMDRGAMASEAMRLQKSRTQLSN